MSKKNNKKTARQQVGLPATEHLACTNYIESRWIHEAARAPQIILSELINFSFDIMWDGDYRQLDVHDHKGFLCGNNIHKFYESGPTINVVKCFWHQSSHYC